MKSNGRRQQFKFKTIGLLVATLFTCICAQARDQVEFLYREGWLSTSSLTAKVPVDKDGNPVPVVMFREEGDGTSRFYLNTVRPQERSQKPQIAKLPRLEFKDIHFIVDGRGERIAAAYPLQKLRSILLTTVHALQGARFENPETENKKRWGLRDPQTLKLLDFALISKIDDVEIIKTALAQTIETEDLITSGYVDHLNVVDQRGLMLTRSEELQIKSHDENYILFRNSQDSLIGYASSGAIIYNETNNKPHSILICASKVTLNAEESVLRNRALKLNTILRYEWVELTPELINGFEKLPCDKQDGRNAGGP